MRHLLHFGKGLVVVAALSTFAVFGLFATYALAVNLPSDKLGRAVTSPEVDAVVECGDELLIETTYTVQKGDTFYGLGFEGARLGSVRFSVDNTTATQQVYTLFGPAQNYALTIPVTQPVGTVVTIRAIGRGNCVVGNDLQIRYMAVYVQ